MRQAVEELSELFDQVGVFETASTLDFEDFEGLQERRGARWTADACSQI